MTTIQEMKIKGLFSEKNNSMDFESYGDKQENEKNSINLQLICENTIQFFNYLIILI